jgi:hypothetical protein
LLEARSFDERSCDGDGSGGAAPGSSARPGWLGVRAEAARALLHVAGARPQSASRFQAKVDALGEGSALTA